MAENNEKLAKARGEKPGEIAIKGAVSTPDTEQMDKMLRDRGISEEKIARSHSKPVEAAPIKLPPKHQFKG